MLSGQKTWASRGAFAEWCFGLFRTDPEAERHRGLTYFLIDMATPGVTVRPIPQIDGETGFAELFFEDVFVPDDLVLGDVGRGWNVAMATAGSERGLSLRSPARYSRAADRLVDLYAERLGRRPGPGAAQRRRGGPGLDGRRGLPAQHAVDRHPGARRRVGRARGQRQQDPLVRDRPGHPPDRPRPARARRPSSTATGSTPRGSTATCSPWPAPSTPAPTRSSGTWWPSACSGCPGAEGSTAMHFAFTDQQLEFRDAVRQVLAKECTTDDVRAAYDAPDRPRSPRWATLAELGVTGLTVPEAHGGLGLGLVDLVPLVEEAGRVALPEPLGHHHRHRRPPAGRPGRHRRDGRPIGGRLARRASPPVR